MYNKLQWLPVLLAMLFLVFAFTSARLSPVQADTAPLFIRPTVVQPYTVHPVATSALLLLDHPLQKWFRDFHKRAIPSPRLKRYATPQYRAYQQIVVGDTLWGLANANDLSVAKLMTMNHIHSDIIYPGQRLIVFEGSHALWNRRQFQVYKRVGLPVPLIPVYQAAGRRFGVPWTVLAAIHRIETHFSTQPEVSYAGAEGPMQFMPATFAYYGVAAPGQPAIPDINNVADAIYSCAHMLGADGYAKNPAMALYLYNHSMDYVASVQQSAQQFQGV